MSDSKDKQKYMDRMKERNEERSTVRKIVAIVLISLAALLIISVIVGFLYIRSSLQPVDPQDNSQIKVEIPIGSSTSQIATILEDNGVIKNELIFRLYTKFNNETGFQAGNYQFTASMTHDEIIDSLKEGKLIKEPAVTITIPEGRNMEQIAELYAKEFDFTKEEFLEKVNNEDYLNELIEKYPELLSEDILNEDLRYALEGYLFSTTYQYEVENPELEEVIEDMLQATQEVIVQHKEQIEERDLTVHEALTMASLLENEARTAESRKRIAGVFYNRIEEDMMLQTDPTVLYALGEHKDRVLYEDLEVDSPYNTYQNKGLPVGPISSFNRNSLEAALNPVESEYLYFLADQEGEIYYSETLKEHNKLKKEHINKDDE
ncbi:endolytic transglycosylase MltG [Halobacillus sp. Marseille-Q1614]|uniref:endolytic transglycosylase MltG n=1 Tax=Halobacillus sp. Marseille-Q1614 TaxID=2709134 RepID=UPI0020C35D53|nr:endolytic transglycosylase MltG [Halobacillus sp. Marseille-Q1614]